MSDARWLDPEATARYISVRIDALPRLVRECRIPKPDYTLGPRSPRWDRNALDAAFGGRTASTNHRVAVQAYVEQEDERHRARRQEAAR